MTKRRNSGAASVYDTDGEFASPPSVREQRRRPMVQEFKFKVRLPEQILNKVQHEIETYRPDDRILRLGVELLHVWVKATDMEVATAVIMLAGCAIVGNDFGQLGSPDEFGIPDGSI